MQTSGRSANELGRLLAAARGYTVFTHQGTAVGSLEGVRYETQVSHPDDIVVRSRGLFRRRRRTFRFESVDTVSAREARIVLRPDIT